MPVVRKVGTQSLAVFLVSMVVAQINGAILDLIGRTAWNVGLVNLAGFAALIATAYVVGWFKSQPWRKPAPAQAPAPAHNSARAPSGALATPAE